MRRQTTRNYYQRRRDHNSAVTGSVNSHRLKARLRLLGGPTGWLPSLRLLLVPLLRGLWLPAVLLVVDHVLDVSKGAMRLSEGPSTTP